MQDGAKAQTSCNIELDYLNEIFSDKVIFQRYPKVQECGQYWPAHSPYLYPCNCFLWGYLVLRLQTKTGGHEYAFVKY